MPLSYSQPLGHGDSPAASSVTSLSAQQFDTAPSSIVAIATAAEWQEAVFCVLGSVSCNSTFHTRQTACVSARTPFAMLVVLLVHNPYAYSLPKLAAWHMLYQQVYK